MVKAETTTGSRLSARAVTPSGGYAMYQYTNYYTYNRADRPAVVAMRVNGATSRLEFVAGQYLQSAAMSGVTDAGTLMTAASKLFKSPQSGLLHELQVYDRALSDSDVLKLRKVLTRKYDAMLAYRGSNWQTSRCETLGNGAAFGHVGSTIVDASAFYCRYPYRRQKT